MPPALTIAQGLNERCACVTLDREKLKSELSREFDAAIAPSALTATNEAEIGKAARLRLAVDKARPHLLALASESSSKLFSDTSIFVGSTDLRLIERFIAAHQRIAALPGWISAALNDAPDIAKHTSAARGVLMGYDFHLTSGGPQLIEVNTNAGGALLNMMLARAQRACCGAPNSTQTQIADAAKIVDMFLAEWRACRGTAKLQHIAIVDEAPLEQYLLPEFLLFQRLFERAGFRASICDSSALRIVNARLELEGEVVDLVYNRSTDFALVGPASAVLRAAWLDDLAVLTPNPRAHALLADKRLLIRLSDPAFLASIGAAPDDIALCQTSVPPTQLVLAADADKFWQSRNEWFFKPANGFGGKAAYRGDKLTRRVFEEILLGNTVAQRIVAPSLRVQHIAGADVRLKSDLRAYSYASTVLLYAARLYQGQTTNFRTPGGGFASVVEVPG